MAGRLYLVWWYVFTRAFWFFLLRFEFIFRAIALFSIFPFFTYLVFVRAMFSPWGSSLPSPCTAPRTAAFGFLLFNQKLLWAFLC